ncbi:hypothetical protein [Vibrio sp. WXL210]|uniref:hypothetical protein n=1 Tax=Vibrio sp. WXL210 TaxID=3450709 RepID=UPI003EC59CA3
MEVKVHSLEEKRTESLAELAKRLFDTAEGKPSSVAVAMKAIKVSMFGATRSIEEKNGDTLVFAFDGSKIQFIECKHDIVAKVL